MQFKDIIGQKNIIAHLISEVQNDKISHAKLFVGDAGFGTLPIALAFAQYVLCIDRTATDSCGKCSACLKVQKLQHADLHFSFPVVLKSYKIADAALPKWREQVLEQPYFNLNQWAYRIDPEGRKPVIGTEESVEIINKLSLKSFEGGYKIMLIWMAEEMNVQCSNKLLKILEEPPLKTIFILCSEKPDQLLPTIVSRTQVLRIPRIDAVSVTQYIKNELNVHQSDVQSIVSRADGSLISVLELVGDHEQRDQNQEMFIQLMRVCFKKDVIKMLDWAEQIGGIGKENQKIFIDYALHMLRQSMLRNYTEEQLIRVSEAESQFLVNFSKFITGNNISEFTEVFNKAYYHIDRNANAKLLFTNLCFNVMRFIHFA